MTRWLQAVRQTTDADRNATPEARADAADKPERGVLSVKSVLSGGEGACPPPAVGTPPARADAPGMGAAGLPYGTACDMGLYPRTWTGRVVSLAAWRDLTDWERHGPRGQYWDGASGQWEQPEEGGSNG